MAGLCASAKPVSLITPTLNNAFAVSCPDGFGASTHNRGVRLKNSNSGQSDETNAPQDSRPLAGAPGAAGCPASAVPCLNTNNCNEEKKGDKKRLNSAHAKCAYAFTLNVLWLIERHGLERIGFLTLTFARHIVDYKQAQKALHSLMTSVLKKRYPEYIIIMERMDSGRIHYHLLVVVAEDIRTGFDFAAVKSGDYRSASAYLRSEWTFWRRTAPKYGFGRTELLPIRKTAKGVAKYIGKYIGKHIGQRLAQDKGARLVRYSKGANRAGVRFSWLSPGAYMWRLKLGTFCRMLGLSSDSHNEFLKEWFGKNWVYVLRPLIEAVKLSEFCEEVEARTSNRALWIVAVNERERRCHRKRRTRPAAPIKPAWGSWIERTLKEELP
jgi:hypothetical protein